LHVLERLSAAPAWPCNYQELTVVIPPFLLQLSGVIANDADWKSLELLEHHLPQSGGIRDTAPSNIDTAPLLYTF
jgi:hypothetical protein